MVLCILIFERLKMRREDKRFGIYYYYYYYYYYYFYKEEEKEE